MADTIETLRADLDALRAEFNSFKALADKVIKSHGPPPAGQLSIVDSPMHDPVPFRVPTA